MIGYIIIALAILIPGVIITLLVLRSKGSIAAGWTLDTYSTNVKLNVTGDTFNFDFPNAYPGAHSVMKHISGLKVGGQVSMTYEITGNAPVFVADGDVATVGLYIGGSRIYSCGQYRIPLALGKKTVIFPLTAENWQTVDGVNCAFDDAHKRQFAQAMSSTTIGPCFGDNHGFAHGVNLSERNGGSAKFSLLSFSP